MRLPSKRQYPDYYLQIKRPIALDDIKSKLELREYTTLDSVRQDFETCFRNAKRYNIKDSQIFKDAKFLHVSSAYTLCIFLTTVCSGSVFLFERFLLLTTPLWRVEVIYQGI